ncbi:MAG: hypothetical protein B7Z67_07765 [Acidiphilium sp. 21-60-14]|nr:MAG: hypothetical protein B7Z67_07765 [Acidiphilium sp. 21-60-14]OYV90325.1 MAG: hypothetical protein B7Z57_09130 [Acidiphilium sp. 37-60-79]
MRRFDRRLSLIGTVMDRGGPPQKHLVLVGGGHSHVEVLRRLGLARSETVRVTLIGRDRFTPYSGMLPGVVAGHYDFADAHIDLKPLCDFAGAHFIEDRVVGLDPDRRVVRCATGPLISYDILSINIGSSPNLAGIPGAEKVGVPVKPINGFLVYWHELVERVLAAQGPVRIGVIGTGAGGIEMVLAVQYGLHQLLMAAGRDPAMVTLSLFGRSDRVLAGYAPGVQARFERILRARGIIVHSNAVVIAAEPGLLRCADGRDYPVDEMLFVTEAGAPPWLREAGITLDQHGFIAVNLALQSLSHSTIFAAGDVASVIGAPRPKSGVFAVRQGPPLAENLRSSFTGGTMRYFQPQNEALALLSTGDRYAVASRGGWTMEGRLMWRWKDWIDRRFMRRYQILPSRPGETAGA